MLINMYLTTVSSDSFFPLFRVPVEWKERKAGDRRNGTARETTRTWDPSERPVICWRSRRMAPEARLTSGMTPAGAKASGGAVGRRRRRSGAMSQQAFQESGLGSGGGGCRPGRWCCPRDIQACPMRALIGPRPAAPHPPEASAAGRQSRPSRKIVRSWCQPRHQAGRTSCVKLMAACSSRSRRCSMLLRWRCFMACHRANRVYRITRRQRHLLRGWQSRPSRQEFLRSCLPHPQCMKTRPRLSARQTQGRCGDPERPIDAQVPVLLQPLAVHLREFLFCR